MIAILKRVHVIIPLWIIGLFYISLLSFILDLVFLTDRLNVNVSRDHSYSKPK